MAVARDGDGNLIRNNTFRLLFTSFHGSYARFFNSYGTSYGSKYDVMHHRHCTIYSILMKKIFVALRDGMNERSNKLDLGTNAWIVANFKL